MMTDDQKQENQYILNDSVKTQDNSQFNTLDRFLMVVTCFLLITKVISVNY